MFCLAPECSWPRGAVQVADGDSSLHEELLVPREVVHRVRPERPPSPSLLRVSGVETNLSHATLVRSGHRVGAALLLARVGDARLVGEYDGLHSIP